VGHNLLYNLMSVTDIVSVLIKQNSDNFSHSPWWVCEMCRVSKESKNVIQLESYLQPHQQNGERVKMDACNHDLFLSGDLSTVCLLPMYG
jgi:hypothetical protein